MTDRSPADRPVDAPIGPVERAAAAARSTWTSVVVNAVLSTVQVVVGVQTRSQALVADGLHSLSDLIGDFVVLVANHHGSKDPDVDHPYGHQRFETAASMALGLLLVMVGAGMLWQAALQLGPDAVVPEVDTLALWIACGTLVAKEGLFRYMLAVGKRVRSSMLVANAWHARSDAASSLVVALGIGGNLAGFPWLDPIAAAIVGFMIARTGWGFAWTALGDLMDRAAGFEEVAAIEATLVDTPGVVGVHALRTRKMGDLILVDVHLEVDATLTVEAGHAISVLARDRVMKRHRVLDVMTHLDPWRPAA